MKNPDSNSHNTEDDDFSDASLGPQNKRHIPTDTQTIDIQALRESTEQKPMPMTGKRIFKKTSKVDDRFDTSFGEDFQDEEEAFEGPQNAKKHSTKRLQKKSLPVSHQKQRLRVIRSSQTGCFSWLFGFVGLTVRILLVTGLVIVTCAWLGWQIASSYIDTEEVPVPNICGLQIETALTVASENKMSIFKERNEPSTLVAPGEIIDQKPSPGTRARKGAIIRVVISGDSEDRQKIPDITGMTQVEATSILKGANLEVGEVTYIEDSSRPANTVITQTPEPGRMITDDNKKVDLLVSKDIH